MIDFTDFETEEDIYETNLSEIDGTDLTKLPES